VGTGTQTLGRHGLGEGFIGNFAKSEILSDPAVALDI